LIDGLAFAFGFGEMITVACVRALWFGFFGCILLHGKLPEGVLFFTR